ncbi:metallophosphoesterase [Acerihabitans arboris]|uniref:Serine/threonine-protein phosphatase n=1 Tax=Acerihabitans arboris TaxID=2691583 RepID=A0A845SI81_9GAMM|nr:metallophosphoesterase [Acerihabitans arboris]NDL62987.1 serine/threonine-protein phosphatase [Acerihabitans arboris]
MYRKIDPNGWRRIFIVGDLHGCYDLLLAKLARQGFDRSADLLISVGDLIDRGAQNLQCLELLEQSWFCAVRGNHEQMAMDALSSSDEGLWLANGGQWFLRLDDEQRRRAAALIERCAGLPLIIDIEMPRRHVVVAHADYPLDSYRYGQAVDPELVVWSRQRINRNQRGRGAPITGASHFFFGHTPLERVRHFYNQFYIDTGAVFGGALTLVELTALPF